MPELPALPEGPNSQTADTRDGSPPVNDEGLGSSGFATGLEQEPAVSNASAPDREPATSVLPYPVVGIGAQQSGTAELIELFSSLPCDTGMAFIVLLNPAPEIDGLPKNLARHTLMPVMTIERGIVPEPDRIYVVPPAKLLSISEGRFDLEPWPEGDSRMPLDRFFRSLAEDQKSRAVGVALSGTGGDGALGLGAIRAEGGVAIVRAGPDGGFASAGASIELGQADLALPLAGIALELARLPEQFSNSNIAALEAGHTPPGEERQFVRILGMLSEIAGIDYPAYKPAILRRRLARRMRLCRIGTLNEFARHLHSHPEDLRQLHEEMLIGATRFFRDPAVFHIIQSEILPRILCRQEPDRPIRIWVPGCSSGEEVYSIAICLIEAFDGSPAESPIQLFGTDVSERLIEQARTGVFPKSIAADVPATRLRRYFLKTDKGFQISKRVRDLCVFARHNLCADPPFSHLDMISCRNVLISFGQDLQKRVIPILHRALRPDGFLVLGISEGIGGFADLFSIIDRKAKIYKKLPPARKIRPYPDLWIPSHLAESAPKMQIDSDPGSWTNAELRRAADRIILARYGCAGFVIDDRFQILQARGHTGRFLERSPGASSLNLFRMLREEIAGQVREAVERAVSADIPVQVEGIELSGDGRPLTAQILPMHISSSPSCAYLVLFLQGSGAGISAPPGMPSSATEDEKDRIVARLRHDLASAKVYLQSLIEERDAQNQQLMTANEELQAANEELQSSNEELETARDELESANNELRTVNKKLRRRNAILSETSCSLSNLLNSINLPVLLVGNGLEIREANCAAQSVMNVRPSDIGRFIGEIRPNLSVENLEPLLIEVLDTLAPRELEVQDREGRWRLLRVRPYRTADNRIEGVALTLADIDDFRRGQERIQERYDFALAVVESTGIPLAVVRPDFSVKLANDAFHRLARLSVEDSQARLFPDLAAALWGMDSLRGLLEEWRSGAMAADTFSLQHETFDGRSFRVVGRPLTAPGERAILVTIEDITERKATEKLLQQRNVELENQIRATEESLNRTQRELRALTARLFTSQEEERRRVARELHDDIGQQLALIEIEMEQLEQEIAAGSADRANVRGLRQKTSRLSESVRSISHRLHPSILDDLGLPRALKALVTNFAEAEKMPATFARRNVPEILPHRISGVLYAIAQEALRNVAKHAGRTHVKVSLESMDGILRMRIADFGEGFDTQEIASGLGLISMAERARLVAGSFSVRSVIGAGTSITVDVPIENE
jgi:two-component system CheB/CheR fusion protein